ncbi:zinc finger MYND domain-containing protein [Phanerochaete sordida]|uniref:Zinc finger MYND domain-containing protein n=1 Tax=Phanerochaete sordida TaxID=48140 RepID=A0A9P3G625_9APHY|nr:zinc finger MYND domain-containing protein [Phanerochaete sordida]
MATRTVRLECLSADGGRAHLEKGLFTPGHTVAVFYALQHRHPQGNGLGPEENDDIVIIPHSLQNLQAANRALWGFHPVACAADNCDETEGLSICASCRLVRYCSPEHQHEHWEKHKGLRKACSALRLSLFTDRDWTKFEKHWRFPV